MIIPTSVPGGQGEVLGATVVTEEEHVEGWAAEQERGEQVVAPKNPHLTVQRAEPGQQGVGPAYDK